MKTENLKFEAPIYYGNITNANKITVILFNYGVI